MNILKRIMRVSVLLVLATALSSCDPQVYGSVGMSSWGDVVQLVVGLLIGVTMGSLVEKRWNSRRLLGMKAEIKQLVEQVRRLQLTNEINQIYGSSLRSRCVFVRDVHVFQ